MSMLRRAGPALLVLAAFLVALVVRLIYLGEVDAGDDGYWLFADDPPYHLRRAMMMLSGTGGVPTWDPYVHFPEGGNVIWPPGMAWILAGLGSLGGVSGPEDAASLEAIAVWVPPIAGALLAPAVYVAGRPFIGRPGAVAAALLAAIVPACVQYSVPGRYDHHFFEPILAITIASAQLVSARAQTPRGRWGWATLGAVSIGAALLIWPGVLLHLGLLVAATLIASWLLGPEGMALAAAGARTCLVAIPLAWPAVAVSAWSDTPVFFSPSPLHLACLGVAAIVLAGSAWPDGRGWLGAMPRRARSAAALALGGAIVLFVPSLHEAVQDGLSYASGNPFATFGGEATSLLADIGPAAERATWPILSAPVVALFGLLFWLKRSEADAVKRLWGRRTEGVFYATVTLLFFVPTLSERRWLSAWVPFAALIVVAGAIAGARWLTTRFGLRRGMGAAISVTVITLMLLPSIGLLTRLEVVSPGQRLGTTFLRQMRGWTEPASEAEFDPAVRPEYGVLAPWWMGHQISWWSGRPTLANNFFGTPWHDEANARALGFNLADDCDAAARDMLGARLRYFVVTMEKDLASNLAKAAKIINRDASSLLGPDGRLRPAATRLLVLRLGPREGQAYQLPPPGLGEPPETVPACGRFRLVAEGRGTARKSSVQGPGEIKLYEVVEGAEIHGVAPPRTPVVATIEVRTSLGRTFRWLSPVRSGQDGVFRLRVPYPTDGSCGLRLAPGDACPTQVMGSGYAVRVGNTNPVAVTVSQDDVRRGASIAMPKEQ